jgi:hypothetical protein
MTTRSLSSALKFSSAAGGSIEACLHVFVVSQALTNFGIVCRMKPFLLLIVTAVAPPLPLQASPTSENIHKWSFWWESNKGKKVLKIAVN